VGDDVTVGEDVCLTYDGLVDGVPPVRVDGTPVFGGSPGAAVPAAAVFP
jgi:hypothetical protein